MPRSLTSPSSSKEPSVKPRRNQPRDSRSLGSPARSTDSVRLSNIVDKSKENRRNSFAVSPLRKSVLGDETEIEIPRRESWWRKVENSRDMIEVLNNDKQASLTNILEEFGGEVLRQENTNYSLDLPESSDCESIHSIVLPKKKLLTQKENVPQKQFRQVISNRESLSGHNKTNFNDKTADVGPKNLFAQTSKRSKPIFPSALLNMSFDKTANKTTEVPQEQRNTLFGNRPGTKRKNMFADFIVSESEDEIPDIQPKLFTFHKKSAPTRRSSAASSITTDIEMDDWKLLPSSTMVEHQLQVDLTTPGKRARLSKLSEVKESTKNSTKQSDHSGTSKNKSKVLSPMISQETNKSSVKDKLKSSTNDETTLSKKKTLNSSKLKETSAAEISPDNFTDKANEVSYAKEKTRLINNTTTLRTSGHNESTAAKKYGTQNNSKIAEKSQAENKLDDVNEINNVKDKTTVINKTVTLIKHSAETRNDCEVQNQQNVNILDTEDLQDPQEDDEIAEHIKVKENQDDDQSKNVAEDRDSQKVYDQDEVKSNGEEQASENEAEIESKNENAINESQNKSLNQVNSIKKIDANDSKKVNASDKGDNFEQEPNRDANKSTIEVSYAGDKTTVIKTASLRKSCHDESNTAKKNANQNKSMDEMSLAEDERDDTNKISSTKDKTVVINKTVTLLKHLSESQNVDKVQNEQENHIVTINNIDTEDLNDQEEDDEIVLTYDDNDLEDHDDNVKDIEVCEEQNDIDDNMQVDEEEHVQDEEEFDVHKESDDEQKVEQQSDDEEEIEQQSDNEQEVSQEIQQQSDDEEEIQQQSGDKQDEDKREDDLENGECQEVDDQEEVSASEDEPDLESENEDTINESQDNVQNESQDQDNEEIYNDDNDEINDNEQETEQEPGEETGNNVTHDTTGRNRTKRRTETPEAILKELSHVDADSFTAKGRVTSIRKTKSILKNFSIRPSIAPPRESTGFSDGTNNTSTEGSAWDSHRTTRHTLRRTLGRDIRRSSIKSLRALVMEKSAIRQTMINEANAKLHEANSTELQDSQDTDDDIDENVDLVESDHEVSKIQQATLEMYVQERKKENMALKQKVEEEVRNSLKQTKLCKDFLNFRMPATPIRRKPVRLEPKKPKATRMNPSRIPLDELPSGLAADLAYKPPKRFNKASWCTKRLYKFLESKLEAKYDYKARVRAEKLVQKIYDFTCDIKRLQVAPAHEVDKLKREMAHLGIVTTHFQFYNFFHHYLPLQINMKVVPDIANKIPAPYDIYADILQ